MATGDVLAGKYRVERVLGMGGMGVVVAATHLELDQAVALKFLLPSALANADAVRRFSGEARAVVRLRSEHVARVIDLGRLESGAPYIVMEYLHGIDLGTVLEQRGCLSVHEAVDYILQACEAVAEAHSLGIVHRDLKPRNLFVTSRVDGQPLIKVLDFGISKFTDDAALSLRQMSLTKTHEVIGSPMYMSPEQLRSSRQVDTRSDIWSLGIILYEVLTGRVPFLADSVTELCAMLLQDPHPPVPSVRPDVPPPLAAVVDRCLQKEPSARFASVAELATALAACGAPGAQDQAQRVSLVAGQQTGPRSHAEPPPPAPPVAVTGGTAVAWAQRQGVPDRQRRARLLVVVAAGIAVSGVAAGWVAWRLRPTAVVAAPANIAPPSAPVIGASAPAESSSVPAVPPPLASSGLAVAPVVPSAARPAPMQQPPHPAFRPHASHPVASAAASAHATSEPPVAATHKRPPDELPNERE